MLFNTLKIIGRTKEIPASRRNLLYVALITLNLNIQSVQASAPIDFTASEMKWIKSHPVITYTKRENWPLEYHENGKAFGLSREFLSIIEKKTGLKFKYIPEESVSANEVMMLSAVYEKFLMENDKKGWLYTSAWMNSMPMIVTKNETTGFRNFNDLKGRKVSISLGSGYINWLNKNYPDIHLIVKNNIADALRSVNKKESDAAIGSGAVVLPILQRKFSQGLAITSQPPELAAGVNMAVRDSYPELRSILDKSFARTTALEVQQAYKEWVGILELGSPTMEVIWEHYRLQILIFSMLFVLLAISLRIATLAKRQAQHSEQKKSNFLAMMSHEIRTPMNAVIASLELLRQTSSPLKRQQYIDLAHSSSQNLLELLNNILDHSKLSQKRLNLENNIFELSEMLEVFCESQRPVAQRKGLQLELAMSKSLYGGWFIGDAHRLRQIMTNLCSNAIKFTHNGSVTVEVTERLIDNRLSNLTFSVTDTGIGIPHESQNRLFDAWEQMAGHTAQQHAGSGLGLFICHELVTLMQGEITLNSNVGLGTKVSFTITMEKYDGQPLTEPTEKIILPNFLNELSILIIEDHPINQKLLKDQLNVMLCRCDVADDGEKALIFLEEENYYDMILLDCNLPGRDGYEVAQLIRQFEEANGHSRTPIIAISALNTDIHFERCMQSGMDDILTKPIRLEDLAGVLKKWCKEELCLTSTLPLQLVIDKEVLAWLHQDALGLKWASETKDLRYSIHYIHRIKGIALMYHLSKLADYATDCEIKLRSKDNAEGWPLTTWSAEIENIIYTYEKNN